tara:strand:- start:5144 stop:6526 length:1383 start_codon:yes stop_codon:yes gene_type:complete
MKPLFQNKFTSISGWGKTSCVNAEIVVPKSIKEIKSIILNAKPQSILVRGNGRTYGDAAQIKEGKVLKLSNFKKINLDCEKNEVNAEAGTTFEEILKVIIPKGFFLPVTPGTKKITLGGAIAADVHGKNHHQDGSFGNFIKSMKIINGIGEEITLTPNKENNSEINNLFWATIGGMGLTGVIINATFSIIPIQTSFISQETKRYKKLDYLMQDMIKNDIKYKYSVAWIDSLHKDLRGILSCGNHTKTEEITNIKDTSNLYFNPKPLTSIPDILKINLMNKLIIKVFNELWFRKSPRNVNKKIVPIENFFYPLDKINNWNNLYGRKGFIQYQIVVPEEHSSMIKNILKKLKQIDALSFLPVLKKLGKANLSFLSFPIQGWTLSIDLPANNKKIEQLLNDLDKDLEKIGGRIYLAKDSRQSSYVFKKTYKFLKIWQKQKQILDPKNIFISDIAKRLKIINSN